MFSSFKVHKTFVNHQHLPKILISNMAAPQIAFRYKQQPLLTRQKTLPLGNTHHHQKQL
jgi:hypothetical protein